MEYDSVLDQQSISGKNVSLILCVWNSVETGSGHPGLTRFTNYPGLTRIGSREKQNCSFDNVETYKRYRVALL